MKKLLIIILLSVGLALGGASGCISTGSGNKTKSIIPNMEYQDVDVFKNGNFTKVPKYIDALSNKWERTITSITKTIKVGHFTNLRNTNEHIDLVVNLAENKVLLIAYADGIKLDYYIYDGRQYPTKTTEEAAKAYIKLIISSKGA